MKKYLLTPLITVLIVLATVGGVSWATPNEAEDICVGDTCIAVPTVTLPGQTITLPGTTVTLPGRTVTPPVRTVTLPRQTVTRRVTLPRQTVVTTRYLRLPQTTKTATIETTVTVRSTQAIPTGAGTTTIRQTPQASVRIVPTPGPIRTVPVRREVKVTVPQAIGLSLGLLLVGLGLGLLALYAAYAVGYKDSERQELRILRRFKTELFGKK